VRFSATALARLICALWQSNPPIWLRVARGKSFTKSPNDIVLAAFATVSESISVLWGLSHGQEIASSAEKLQENLSQLIGLNYQSIKMT